MTNLVQNFAIGLAGPELWVIVILVLVLFGAKKIPELMRSVGQGVGELQKGINESKRTLEQAANEASNSTTDEHK
ncbi:MAG: twin-arginine translocase TatA/TatE family subunit [Fimbriimonadales bacterium]